MQGNQRGVSWVELARVRNPTRRVVKTEAVVAWSQLGSPTQPGRYTAPGLREVPFVAQSHIDMAARFGGKCVVTLVPNSVNPDIIKEWVIWKIEAETNPEERIRGVMSPGR